MEIDKYLLYKYKKKMLQDAMQVFEMHEYYLVEVNLQELNVHDVFFPV